MLTLLVLLAGCDGGSDFDWTDTFDPDRVKTPTVDTDPPTYTDPGAEDCVWVGTWEVVSAKCGDASFSDWRSVYDSAILVASHNHEEGCDLVFTLSNETCTEEATWWADPTLDATQITIEDNTKDDMPFGVTYCDPDACQFTNSDIACAVGDHATPQTVVVDQSTPDTLVFAFFAAYAAPSCNDGLYLTMQKK